MSELETFRAQVRAWLAERYAQVDPAKDDERGDTIARAPEGHAAMVQGAIDLQQALYAAGFWATRLPVEYGGQGLTRAHDDIVNEELMRFDCPSLRPLGIGMGLAMPTILGAAGEEQKRRFLPKLVAAEEVWCQLFSEPDAGSDLVSLRCKAVRDGDTWVITGQKVWSSFASDAQFGMLLARTDPNAEKPHSGITMFILPMDRKGVTVVPLVDIAGGHHFNEVFLEDVVLHDDEIIGEVNRGWQVANGTLSGERSGYLGGSGKGRRRRQALAAATAAGKLGDPVVRDRIVDITARERILELLAERIHAGVALGGNPAAGSLVKVFAGDLEQQSSELVIDLRGAAGVAWEADQPDADYSAHALSGSRQARIAGGTHEIQRNLMGERILGLPREAR
ncbi:MAG: acyl-CoA dehydrogenase family protein [Actinomycetota bacterium]|nr:acyl-CoA dehydrogenase family protein [Actinomycetota bacterium]